MFLANTRGFIQMLAGGSATYVTSFTFISACVFDPVPQYLPSCLPNLTGVLIWMRGSGSSVVLRVRGSRDAPSVLPPSCSSVHYMWEVDNKAQWECSCLPLSLSLWWHAAHVAGHRSHHQLQGVIICLRQCRLPARCATQLVYSLQRAEWCDGEEDHPFSQWSCSVDHHDRCEENSTEGQPTSSCWTRQRPWQSAERMCWTAGRCYVTDLFNISLNRPSFFLPYFYSTKKKIYKYKYIYIQYVTSLIFLSDLVCLTLHQHTHSGLGWCYKLFDFNTLHMQYILWNNTSCDLDIVWSPWSHNLNIAGIGPQMCVRSDELM